MRIPFVYRRPEGTMVRNGINWQRDSSSRIVILLKLGRFLVYFRIRSARVSGKRVLFDVDWLEGRL
jgi:hypothetical protein